jgi:hypothetical protein
VLKDDPLELLGEKTWQAMLDVSTVYEREKDQCTKLIEATNFPSPTLKEGLEWLTCNMCGSDLLKPVKDGDGEIYLQCSSCGDVEYPDSYVERAIESALHSEAYVAEEDGGDAPYTQCPHCGKESYVMEEHRCAYCGEEAEHNCASCGNKIPPEELILSPYCSYCEHMLNKDD